MQEKTCMSRLRQGFIADDQMGLKQVFVSRMAGDRPSRRRHGSSHLYPGRISGLKNQLMNRRMALTQAGMIIRDL